MGVTNAKKINSITTGAMNLPKISPILIQILLNGPKKEGFIKEITKKNIATIKDHNLIFPEKKSGHNPIIIKTIKNSNPKLLLEDDFITFRIIYDI